MARVSCAGRPSKEHASDVSNSPHGGTCGPIGWCEAACRDGLYLCRVSVCSYYTVNAGIVQEVHNTYCSGPAVPQHTSPAAIVQGHDNSSPIANSVRVGTRLRVSRNANSSSIPGIEKGCGYYAGSYPVGTNDYSVLCSAEVNNSWSYTSTPWL
jgi:hypothetical protein